MQRRLFLVLAFAIVAGCYSPSTRGGVTPYPPGPVDMLSIIFGNDYSRLCPQHYDYCRAGKHSLCCPHGGCCEDADGRPTCCERGYAGDYDDRGRPPQYDREYDRGDRSEAGPCGPRSTTCSRGRATICCAEDEGCCSDDQGLYCCGSRRGGY